MKIPEIYGIPDFLLEMRNPGFQKDQETVAYSGEVACMTGRRIARLVYDKGIISLS